MKAFIKKIFLFIGLFALIGVVIGLIFPAKKYWGNKEYLQKLALYKNDHYNTVFFGSSRILTGINPVTFDSLANTGNTLPKKSFNFATTGTWANETFYLYEEFLRDTSLSKNVEVVFMEFQNIMAIKPEKLFSRKAIYYQSASNLKFVADYCLSEMKSGIQKIPTAAYMASSHTLAYIQNTLNFNRLNNQTGLDSLAYKGIDSRGFLALSMNNEKRKSISVQQLADYKRSVNKHMNKPMEGCNIAFFDKCMAMIKESKKKGIHIIFLLPPVTLTKRMADVFNSLPRENRIEMCDPDRFPELYFEENWKDETHLNRMGSAYLSKYFYLEYCKLLENQTTQFHY
jgi:hypothetical protein